MFRYTSVLKTEYLRELERLLFFNSAQQAAHSAIKDSIEMFGEPFVENDGVRLRVNVRKLADVQTLFILDGYKLAGVVIFARVSYERIVLIHIAVHEDYSSGGRLADKKLVQHVSQKLRTSLRRIKGVKFIRIMYGNNRTRDYWLRGHSRKFREIQILLCGFLHNTPGKLCYCPSIDCIE